MARRPSGKRSPRSSVAGPRRSGSGATTRVLTSLDAVIGPARAAGVPVFTSIPGSAARGALFDLGADYHRVGESVGRLAARVLGRRVARGHADPLRGPARVLDQPGCARAAEPGAGRPPRDRRQGRRRGRKGGAGPAPPTGGDRRAVAERASPPVADLEDRPGRVQPSRPSWRTCIEGFRAGLKEAGLVEGQDYTTTYRNAQGDIATLNALSTS